MGTCSVRAARLRGLASRVMPNMQKGCKPVPGAGSAATDVLKLACQPVRSGTQTVALVVDRPPAFVGVDPFIMCIDRNAEENLAPVTR